MNTTIKDELAKNGMPKPKEGYIYSLGFANKPFVWVERKDLAEEMIQTVGINWEKVKYDKYYEALIRDSIFTMDTDKKFYEQRK